MEAVQNEVKETSPKLGSQLRQARLQQKVSLRELASRIGVSPSFLSQVERDLATPSVGKLYSLVSELGLSLDSMMGASQAGDSESSMPQAAAKDADAQEVAIQKKPDELSSLQRSHERPEIFIGGVRWERLTPAEDPDVEFLRVTYSSGSESCPPNNLSNHGGKEYFHILSGQLDVQVAFTHQTLQPGDSINFDSSIPHRLSNPYKENCVAIWFVVGR